MRSRFGLWAIFLVINILLFHAQVYSANDAVFFSDVSEKWQQAAIQATLDQGIVKEYPDGTFRPNQKVTEAEFAEMITKFAAESAVDALPGDHWAQPYYDVMAQYEMPLGGYANILCRDRPITRGLAARVIARLYGYDLNVADAVAFMYANNLASGRNEVKDFESYGAFDLLTRVEAAVIFNAMEPNKKAVFKGIDSDLNRGPLEKSALYHSPALPVVAAPAISGRYALFQGQTYIFSMDDASAAEQFARQFAGTYLIDQAGQKLVWANFDKAMEFTDGTKQGSLFLVNGYYPVAAEYQANNMINLAASTSYMLRVSNNNMYIDEAVLNPLQNMLNDIYYAGANQLLVISAYRSYQTQTMLFQSRVNKLLYSLGPEDARKQVAMSTAVPGTSEHQIGLALDFSTLSSMTTTQSFAATREGQWLHNNSWKYGFVIRYKADKSFITGIINEPWHLRYVGRPHAEFMYESGMCLEEYLEYIYRERAIDFSDYTGHLHGIYYFDSVNSEDLLNLLYLSDNVSALSGDGKGGIIVTTNK